jgi:iron complex transport system ATP-binding protein
VAMRDGSLVAAGRPSEVITADTVRDVFGLESLIIDDPVSGTPLVVPISSNAGRTPQLASQATTASHMESAT